jgi:Uma2 family endonuclease
MAHDLLPSDDYIPSEIIGRREPITPKQFEEFCGLNRKLRLELSSTGKLIILPFRGALTSARNVKLTCQLVAWTRKDGSGMCVGSDTVFSLPNGAQRLPSAAWFKREKFDRLTKEERNRIPPFCPDFVVELRDSTDSVTELRAKMVEYMQNGALLGWLIDLLNRRVYVYQPHQEVVLLENPETVSGEPLLPGFKLNLTELWSKDL